MVVELIDNMGDDARVVRAARVSTGLDLTESSFEATSGLIRFLMKNRHGTPFEHNAFTFRVECPIFVSREFMRHRIASYNEESGRYKQLDPVFWIPAPARPLVQEGKPGAYTMRPGTMAQYEAASEQLKEVARHAYSAYEDMLNRGIAREVARACLPVSIYTSFYVTFNARSMMNFLSLRVDDPDALFPSKPQYEIEQVALQVEEHFSHKMPITYGAFTENKRVAP
jgi:thymidylate synthase (FAD)